MIDGSSSDQAHNPTFRVRHGFRGHVFATAEISCTGARVMPITSGPLCYVFSSRLK